MLLYIALWKLTYVGGFYPARLFCILVCSVEECISQGSASYVRKLLVLINALFKCTEHSVIAQD